MNLDNKTQEMYDSRRGCPVCGHTAHILICYDGRFLVRCRHCYNEWVLPTKMEPCERFPLRVRTKSTRQAIKDWNRLAEIESWRLTYKDGGDGSLMCDIDRDDDGTPIEDIGRYEVVFDFESVRYYCYLNAVDSNEAMDMFLEYHPGVTMKHVVDTLEV